MCVCSLIIRRVPNRRVPKSRPYTEWRRVKWVTRLRPLHVPPTWTNINGIIIYVYLHIILYCVTSSFVAVRPLFILLFFFSYSSKTFFLFESVFSTVCSPRVCKWWRHVGLHIIHIVHSTHRRARAIIYTYVYIHIRSGANTVWSDSLPSPYFFKYLCREGKNYKVYNTISMKKNRKKTLFARARKYASQNSPIKYYCKSCAESV
jgi:hypothetical protein